VRSKVSQHTIAVTKRTNLGQMPFYVQLAHKGLEKAKSEPTHSFGKTHTYIVPKDILKIGLSDHSLLDDIETVEFTYAE